MVRIACLLWIATALPGCAVTAVAGAVVEAGATAAKTGAKAGGAVADGAIDAVDDDEEPTENNR